MSVGSVGLSALMVVGALFSAQGRAAAEAPRTQWNAVEFSMKPVAAAAAAWTVRFDASGLGSYTVASEAASGPTPLTVSASTMERLRRGERAAKSGRCETRVKNIARTGEKTIRYEFPDRTVSCTFNYSDDAGLMDAEAAFEAIATTMREGQQLQHEERYDRLGLDAEIDALIAEVREGEAIEVRNIAPVLKALVADEQVIDRVRRKAARLLQDPGAVASAEDWSAR